MGLFGKKAQPINASNRKNAEAKGAAALTAREKRETKQAAKQERRGS